MTLEDFETLVEEESATAAEYAEAFQALIPPWFRIEKDRRKTIEKALKETAALRRRALRARIRVIRAAMEVKGEPKP